MSDTQWVRQDDESDICSETLNLRVIKRQLWCCCSRGGGKLLAFDSRLQSHVIDYVSKHEAARLGHVYDVVELCDDHVVLATHKGLFNTVKTKLKKGKNPVQ